MGEVWLAEHELLGSQAAIKVLHRTVTRQPELVHRFFLEAKATTRLNQPGIVKIFDYGSTDEGLWFIIMEYLDGETLQECLAREGRLSVERAVEFGKQIATSLASAHESGVIHRDLKPANLIIIADRDMPGGKRIKLLDFGIAKLIEGETSNVELTQVGSIVGTPAYMSPEQCRGGLETEPRSDCYSLGCVMFRILTGLPPFVGQSSGQLIISHGTEVPPRLREQLPSAPQVLDDLIESLLAKTPTTRPTAEQAREVFEEISAQISSTFTPLPDRETSIHEVSLHRNRAGDGTMAGTRVTDASAPIVHSELPGFGEQSQPPPTAHTTRDPLQTIDSSPNSFGAQVAEHNLRPLAPVALAPPMNPELSVTTLGSSAGVARPAFSSQRRLWPLAILAITAAAAATFAIVTLATRDNSKVTSSVEPDASVETETAAVIMTVDASTAKTPIPVDASAELKTPLSPGDAAPRVLDASPDLAVVVASPKPPVVRLTSNARRASVRFSRRGKVQGKAPFKLEFSGRPQRTVWLSAPGFRTQKFVVRAGDRSTVRLKLTRIQEKLTVDDVLKNSR